MNFVRRGQGRPLLLIHGLGGNWRSWETIIDALAIERQVIAVDLPGFGETPALKDEVSIATLADAVTAFLDEHGLRGVDVVGSSMGARLVLELARRGVVGTAIALDPGGFWSRGERRFFGFTIGVSIRLVRLLQPLMPFMTTNPITRSLLLAQLSAHPWRLPADATLNEMRSYAAAPSFDAVLDSLANGPPQPGLSVDAMKGPIEIVWGRQDRVCFPRQSRRAMARFPGARLTWFEECGHFPHWDQPQQTVRFILSVTSPHGAQAMTDQPIREPEPPDRRLDKTDQEPESEEDSAPIRPSAAEGGGGEDGGPRPPRPSQAEGERDPSD